jgi:hypothetical protein
LLYSVAIKGNHVLKLIVSTDLDAVVVGKNDDEVEAIFKLAFKNRIESWLTSPLYRLACQLRMSLQCTPIVRTATPLLHTTSVSRQQGVMQDETTAAGYI